MKMKSVENCNTKNEHGLPGSTANIASVCVLKNQLDQK